MREIMPHKIDPKAMTSTPSIYTLEDNASEPDLEELI